MLLGMKETRREDVIYLYGLVGSQTISFSVPHFLFSQWASVRKKQEPLVVQTPLRVSPQPAATLWPLLREACWMRGHNPSLPLVLWVAFLPPWPITPPLLGLGNLACRTQRQKPWKLPANEDSGRQGCLSLARSLGQHGCLGERQAQQPWSQWGVLGTGAAVVPVAAREGRPRRHKKCPKSYF